MSKIDSTSNRFHNMRGGSTVEVRIRNDYYLAAYVDFNEDGTIAVQCFDPSQSSIRTHQRKTLRGAQSVLDKHLDNLNAERVTL